MKFPLILSIALLLAVSLPQAARAQASVTIDPPSQPVVMEKPTLLFNVTASPELVTAPGRVTLHFQITNNGSTQAAGLHVNDTLPVGWSYADLAYPEKFSVLGSLAAGETIAMSVPVDLSVHSPSGRVVYEAVLAAANADSVEADAGVDVSRGQVLGASTVLAETGNSGGGIFLLGVAIFFAGLWRTKKFTA